ncbi:MAG: VOC family protein [Alphaproteobacteria bacterium]|nr:VOC family protein [Alphaproteobacteria bacterium]
MSETLPGRFVWYELMTSDAVAASDFYTRLLPWTANASEEMPGYTMLHVPALERHAGGLMATPDEMGGAPPHWAAYVTVNKMEDAVAAIQANGGQMLTEIIDIPNIGRFAVATDPLGAVIYPFEGAEGEGGEDASKPDDHTFCWSQLMSPAPEETLAFYQAVFGWTASPMPNGFLFHRGEQMVASAMKTPADAGAPPHWLSYVAVPDVDETFNKANALGAVAYHAPADIPGMGRFAVLADPTGATFALWKDAGASAVG